MPVIELVKKRRSVYNQDILARFEPPGLACMGPSPEPIPSDSEPTDRVEPSWGNRIRPDHGEKAVCRAQMGTTR